MKTWNEYKEHVKNVDPDLSKDIHETEEIAAVVSAMVQQRNKLGLSQRTCTDVWNPSIICCKNRIRKNYTKSRDTFKNI